MREDAESTIHKIMHYPENPFCAICQRAKMQRKPCRRNKVIKGDPPTEYGQSVTMDHVVANSERSLGITGDSCALIIGDKATGWVDGFPLPDKSSNSAQAALREFAGTIPIVRAWTDCSAELCHALDALKVIHDRATPYKPQTNGRAERLVRLMMEYIDI